MPQRATLDSKFEEAYRAEHRAASRALVCCSLRRCLRGAGISAHAAAATLAVCARSCADGLFDPRLEVVSRGARTVRCFPRRADRARGRVVGKLRRPGAVRPGAPRGAREPRRQDRRRARARRASRRDDQPLVAAARASASARPGFDHDTGYGSPSTSRPFRTSKRLARRPRRLLGSRSLRSPAGGRSGGRGRHAGGRTQRARRAPAGDDRRREPTTSRWSARCASSRPCARSRRRRTRRCAS